MWRTLKPLCITKYSITCTMHRTGFLRKFSKSFELNTYRTKSISGHWYYRNFCKYSNADCVRTLSDYSGMPYGMFSDCLQNAVKLHSANSPRISEKHYWDQCRSNPILSGQLFVLKYGVIKILSVWSFVFTFSVTNSLLLRATVSTM